MPASILSQARAVYYLYIALAALAFLLRVPAGRPRWSMPAGLLWPFAGFFAWALVTVLWSPLPEQALERWISGLGLIGLTLLTCGAAEGATTDERRVVARALAAGFAVAIALLLLDCYGDAAVSRVLSAEATVRDARDNAARSLFLLSLAGFALATRIAGIVRLLPLLLMFALCVLLEHGTGWIGMALALAILALASWSDRLARAFWIAALLAAVLISPIQGLLLQALSDDTGWMPRSLEVRQQIWRFSAERALEHPIFGWGLEASRAIPNYGEETLLSKGGAIISNHTHNIPLQLWLELGIPGLALFGWFLFRVKRHIGQPMAQAILLYMLVFAVLSAGFWRPRWVAIACCGAALYCLVAPRREQPPPADRA